ncbi:MAG: hypothetical protein IK082_11420, partial [Oscillospiraceae bacterium]|nr:hypothetical protein [Oscillospiraceae bacterium]
RSRRRTWVPRRLRSLSARHRYTGGPVRGLWDEAEALSGFPGEYYMAGDCKSSRNIISASGEGWTVARNIGRR